MTLSVCACHYRWKKAFLILIGFHLSYIIVLALLYFEGKYCSLLLVHCKCLTKR